MAENQEHRSELRRYLLSTLASEDRREEIEQRLIADEAFHTELLAEEDELIDDYISGDLSPDELAALRANFIITDDRRARIAIARHLHEHARSIRPASLASAPKPGFFAGIASIFRMRPLAVSGVALLLVAVGLFTWFATRPAGESSDIIAAMNKAYERERPLESRISGLSYAPKIDRRGPGDAGTVDTNARTRAELLATAAYEENASAATLHALARVRLAKQEIAGAATLLEQSVRIEPTNPAALSDLGTAYLELAGKAGDDAPGRRFELLARSLEQIDRALAAKPDLPEALFNRAIVLGKLSQPGQEAAAWRRYLEVDSTSGWADEARQRLAALEGKASSAAATAETLTAEFLTAYRQNDADRAFEIVSKNREMITGKLIPQQLAFLFADTGDTEYIDAMRFVGEMEAGRTGDMLWRDAAAYYTARGTASIADLKRAQDKVRAGYLACERQNCSGATALFTEARSIFAAAGAMPEAAIAEYWIGYTQYRFRDYSASERTLTQAERESTRLNYHWLRSQHLTWLAQLDFGRDNSSRRIDLSRRALELADRTYDDYNRQKLYESLATAYQRTGAMDDSMNFIARGLELANSGGSSQRQRWRTMNQASEILASLGLFAAAEAMELESLDLTRREIGEPSFEYMSLLFAGRFAAKRGDRETATARFGESRAVAETFPTEQRVLQSAFIDLIEANALREWGDCLAALPLYDRAVAFYDIDEFTLDRYDAYKGRLMCYVATSDAKAIDRDASVILAILDKYRKDIREESNRNAFFGREQEVFDTLVTHELSRGNIEAAFDHAERSRSRTLLDMMAGTTAGTGSETELKLPEEFRREMTFSEIRTKVPADVQIVQFAVLPEKTVAWIIRDGELRHAEAAIRASDLSEKVTDYVALLSVAGDAAKARREPLARELYSLLIEPIRGSLAADRTLVLVPDKSLAGLPFASLVSPATGEYLLREFELQNAPSSTIFIALSERPAAEQKEESVLAVLSLIHI
ncbi:MAG: CHAT domain-containing protein [Pyrinomonadaceae bacterium]|nr:CHAT domain-containing protein [Pyrinomonadaceae bacterium]